ncbi:hypothetical protein JB92DRAFT_3121862 [Gautieria morchelliformis]|nr:hypothetical protein JB92DRAFT_3121862 [Gautieria morchelliformis]
MHPTLGDLLLVLTAYFPDGLSVQRVFYALAAILSLQAVVQLNRNQRCFPGQPQETGWEKDLQELVHAALHPEESSTEELEGEPPGPGVTAHVSEGLTQILAILDWDTVHIPSQLAFSAYPILCTAHINCVFCPGPRPLTRHETVTIVPLLGRNLQWGKARLIVAGCRQCRAVYYVDHVTRPCTPHSSSRVQHLEYETPFLRVSKTENIWVDRRVAQFQEAAIFWFKASWQGFADVLNRSFLRDSLLLRDAQTHKLFVEHFTWRLVVAHGLENVFTCAPDPSADNMTKALLGFIGSNRGIVPGSLSHVCLDCAHQKRSRSDNVEDPQLGSTPDDALAEVDDPGALGGAYAGQPLRAGLHLPAPAPEVTQVWVRMDVMDGKTLTHRVSVWALQQDLTQAEFLRYVQWTVVGNLWLTISLGVSVICILRMKMSAASIPADDQLMGKEM